MKTKTIYGYAPEEAVIMEMTTDGAGAKEFEVPVSPELLDQLKEGDDEPMFVTIEVLNDGTSNNGNIWTKEAIARVAEQINSKRPDGYWGHLSKEERSYKYPDPQTIWLGATVKEINGKCRLFAKGYVLPEAKKLRTYLKKAKVAGKNVAVSVYGKVRAKSAAGLKNMANFVLESVDWARPGSEGVRNMGVFTVTAEMTDEDETDVNKGGEMKTREEVLKSAKASELKEHNPELVSEIVSEMTAEVSAKEAEYEALVSEMTEVKEALGLDDESGKTVTQVIQEMREKIRTNELDNQLREKVEVPAARKVIRQLVVSEMTAEDEVSEAVDRVLASETGSQLVKDMMERAPKVTPAIDRPAVAARKWTKKK